VPSYFNDVYFLVLHLHFVFLLFFLSFYLFIYTSAYKSVLGIFFAIIIYVMYWKFMKEPITADYT
jgi:hypothetical protein